MPHFARWKKNKRVEGYIKRYACLSRVRIKLFFTGKGSENTRTGQRHYCMRISKSYNEHVFISNDTNLYSFVMTFTTSYTEVTISSSSIREIIKNIWLKLFQTTWLTPLLRDHLLRRSRDNMSRIHRTTDANFTIKQETKVTYDLSDFK